jgi:hypothetical protein
MLTTAGLTCSSIGDKDGKGFPSITLFGIEAKAVCMKVLKKTMNTVAINLIDIVNDLNYVVFVVNVMIRR